MNTPFAYLLVLAAAPLSLGCSNTTSSDPPTTPTTVEPPAPLADGTPTTAEPTAPPAETPPGDPPTDEPKKPGADEGRLAFTTCTPESRQAKGCTREYRPVCGHVDTRIRCVRAPCPSVAPTTFPNACTACADAKTTGYFPMACEDMQKPSAP
ncbi:hypothetical protein [Chondromyces crocatus]|uniref:Kazal-like domain-containing protein n=1 Tax=Chondromyces crocatus TaxID=52 RepID=A0A0K1E725_CHOCO|nr:hypothetical protein [Chondromyces crocatus]AKT36378.1 uncharacterized protein CMC5_004910 [Chondromyces crocatus]